MDLKPYPVLTSAIQLMLFDNGCVNRLEPLDYQMQRVEQMLDGSCGPWDLHACEVFLVGLTPADVEEFVIGESRDYHSEPPFKDTHDLLNYVFERI